MTYSIVARDAAAGQLGVAIASHVPGIGARSTWAQPGIGVVVTQAYFAIHYGPEMLALLGEGLAANDALDKLTNTDSMAALRQVAAIDVAGTVATHDGPSCIPHAGHVRGSDYSCQANMLLNPGGPQAMSEAFEASSGASLKDRLLAALDAAESIGGDIRGRQGASMTIVSETTEQWTGGWLLDFRVDDHPSPLGELRRLCDLSGAMAVGGDEGAQRYFEVGNRNPEIWFFRGIELANSGDFDAGRAALERAYDVSDNWRELLRRMPFLVPSEETRNHLLR
jgi:uncharacterized Ntn-hydrolase superfamily protein